MRDFLDFEISAAGMNQTSTLWVIRHNKRDIAVEFTTPNRITTSDFPSVVADALRAYSEAYNAAVRKSMTPAQKNYYDKLVEFHRMEGRAPSYEEQCFMLGVKSKGTPHHYAKALERAGWVWFDGRAVIPYEIAEPHLDEAENGES